MSRLAVVAAFIAGAAVVAVAMVVVSPAERAPPTLQEKLMMLKRYKAQALREQNNQMLDALGEPLSTAGAQGPRATTSSRTAGATRPPCATCPRTSIAARAWVRAEMTRQRPRAGPGPIRRPASRASTTRRDGPCRRAAALLARRTRPAAAAAFAEGLLCNSARRIGSDNADSCCIL